MAELKIKADSGGGTVALKGPATTTSNAAVQLTLPVDDGTANQYLKTDGSGALSWSTVSTGVSSDAQNNTVAGTNSGTNLDGSSASKNTFFGYNAGNATDTSSRHVAIGYDAMKTHTATAASGFEHNVAVGNEALKLATSSYSTVAIGSEAMENSVDGYVNTLIGYQAGKDGFQSGNGHYNIGMGYRCLNSATGAGYNIAIGGKALEDLEGGDYNVTIGHEAGTNITSGSGNCVHGYGAYAGATTGSYNVAFGYEAMNNGVVTGSDNVGIGKGAMKAVANGSQNVGIGLNSGTLIGAGFYNTCVGVGSGSSLTSGQTNVCIGYDAGKNQISTQSNNLYIARSAVDQANAAAWVVGGSSGSCVQGNNSSSWTTTSDERIKKNIVDNTEGLSVIDKVKVRNFKYKQYTKDSETELYTTPVSSEDTIDLSSFTSGTAAHNVVARQGVTETQIGVIAQELETVCPGCVETDEKGLKTVDTDELFWHMLNAIKELSTKVKALEAG